MNQQKVKTYIEKYFKNIKQNDLKDFCAHGICCEKICKAVFNSLISGDFFEDSEKRLYKNYEKLLYLACNIHDLGIFIPGEKPHNKKGAKFILENKIDGLQEEENLIIANIVRFHRGKSPKDKNKIYGILSDDLKLVVRLFSGILKVSDALDYGHYEIIENVLIKDDNKNKELIINLDCDLSQHVGFNLVFKKKKKLLEKVIKRKIIVK